MTPPLYQLPAHAAESRTHAYVVIETPKGGRNKLAFNPELGTFKLEGVLPEGHSFPYDFGFAPSTLAEDGDPLDVLLLLETPTFPGVVVEARLLGALEMEQLEPDGTVQRNDRLLAVAANSHEHNALRSITDLSTERLHEIKHFSHSYNGAKGVKVLRRVGPQQAQELVTKALHTY